MTSGRFVGKPRHLVVAAGAWAGRTILGEPVPYYRLGLLHPADPPAGATAAGIDVDARPSLAEVPEVRGNRMALVRGIPGGSPAPGLELVCAPARARVTRRKHARPAAACAWS